MQTDYLRYFIDVATLGSMSAAAKRNFMTPQGVSRAISALEAELDCELFLRDSNKVTLTGYGEHLLENARELIARENDIRRSIVDIRDADRKKSRTHYTFYSSPVFFDTPLFFPVSGFNIALYGKVQFLQRSTPNVIDLLVDAARAAKPDVVVIGGLGLFDLFADENVTRMRRLEDAGYEYRPLLQTHDYVLVPAYSTLARAEFLTKDDIRAHNLAVAASGGMERAIACHIGSESIFVSSADSAYRSHLCRMGEALTFVPGLSLVFGAPEGTVAVPMQEPYTIEIGFAARPGSYREGLLPDILDRLVDFYAKYQDMGTYRLLDGKRASSLFVR